jgi:hypothetical protein
MKLLKRLTALSVEDLLDLQEAILEEIEHRKELAANSTPAPDESPVSLPLAETEPDEGPTPATPRPKRRRAA